MVSDLNLHLSVWFIFSNINSGSYGVLRIGYNLVEMCDFFSEVSSGFGTICFDSTTDVFEQGDWHVKTHWYCI